MVRVQVKPNNEFERIGDDLKTIQTIDLFTALLGGDKIMNTLDGKVKVKIPMCTQNEQILRIKGKGMPIYDRKNLYGDLLVQLNIRSGFAVLIYCFIKTSSFSIFFLSFLILVSKSCIIRFSSFESEFK